MRKEAERGRLLCLALALCLLAGLLGACGNGGAQKSALWGKELYAEPEEVPSAALQGENAQCCGVAPGGRLLIIADDTSFLYDTETGKQIPLRSGNEYAPEGLICKAKGWFCEQRSGEWMQVFKPKGGGRCLLNTSTGAYYRFREETPLDGQGEEILLLSRDGLSLSRYDCKTGVCTPVEWGDTSDAGTLQIMAGGYLPSGGLYAVARDPDQPGTELRIREADGSEERYSLGVMHFAAGDRVVRPAGERWLLLYDSVTLSTLPLLVDRKEGTVSVLFLNQGKAEPLPLQELLRDNGTVQISDEQRTQLRYCPILEIPEENCLLLALTDSHQLALYRPDAPALQLIPGEFFPGEYISGDGEGLLFSYQNGLVRLKER